MDPKVDIAEFPGCKMIRQGAEGRIYVVESFLGRPAIVKERFPRRYRQPELDRLLTTRRMKEEAKNLVKAHHCGLNTPMLYFLDLEKSLIVMEKVEGQTVKDALINGSNFEKLASTVGQELAKLHDSNIVHGDLTTSNMIIDSSNEKLYLIDFGLSYQSNMAEDKAVDLYVLERAFVSTHPDLEIKYQLILEAYRKYSKESKSTLRRLEDVRLRGRKRSMVG